MPWPGGFARRKKKGLTGWHPIIKRGEDLIIGSLLLALSAPLWPLIALAIRLEGPGPIIFTQRRRGRYLHEFRVLKFRTMRVMEDGANVKQAVPSDQRVTRIGRILRRTSLDELPQLLNVLRGEMSLVGPRPHALAHDEEFTRLLERYPDRHQMRPGLTGLAQVTGLRGSTSKPGSIQARVEADLVYIRNWSLLLDLKILARTVRAVILGTNAD